MQDYIYHGQLREYGINFTFALTTQLCNESIVQHDCDPFSAHIFSRALTAGACFSTGLNEHEKLNLQWHYGGALKTLIVDVRANGGVRGIISPDHLAPDATTPDKIYGGDGHLNVILSNESGRILNSGTVPTAFQNVVQDVAYFYSHSLQVETELNVMVGFTNDPEAPVTVCQGLLLQAQPEADLI